jgi:hypothetical protein
MAGTVSRRSLQLRVEHRWRLMITFGLASTE